MIERRGHGFSLDWYMLGLFAYELLDGYPPYYDKNKEKLMHNIKCAKLRLPSNISAECGDFLT
jgi:serine/threonine protein kinase